MLNINQIKNAAEIKGWEIEIQEAHEDSCWSQVVGIHKGREVWHWFNVASDGTSLFCHSYNRNTGSVNRSWSRNFSVQESIEKVLEKHAAKVAC